MEGSIVESKPDFSSSQMQIHAILMQSESAASNDVVPAQPSCARFPRYNHCTPGTNTYDTDMRRRRLMIILTRLPEMMGVNARILCDAEGCGICNKKNASKNASPSSTQGAPVDANSLPGENQWRGDRICAARRQLRFCVVSGTVVGVVVLGDESSGQV